MPKVLDESGQSVKYIPLLIKFPKHIYDNLELIKQSSGKSKAELVRQFCKMGIAASSISLSSIHNQP